MARKDSKATTRSRVDTPDRVDTHRRRGRPTKFGRPSQVVALTLPDDVVRGLQKVNPDIARAIVGVYENAPTDGAGPERFQPAVELVTIADRRSLIVVNRAVVKSLPGVNIIPLHGDRAFLALEPGKSVADLELAVVDRLDGALLDDAERTALTTLRVQLKNWRTDRSLVFHSRSIIVVERMATKARKG